MACKGFDGQVVRQDSKINELLHQFACVRFVRMNGLDLSQFQFDYDQTWAVLFLRPDGTVLARYGSRNSTDAMALNSMAGLNSTMQRVLEAHRRWPERKDLYGDKRGTVAEFQRPEDIPSDMIKKTLARGPNSKASCIHCHNVYDARRDVAISNGNYDPRKRWKYPMPESIGLEVDPVSGTIITEVLRDSAAERAGMEVGEEIDVINGQAIHSLADIQFALHFLPDEAVAHVTIKPAGSEERKKRSLHLKHGWRESNMGWRASMYGMPPRPGLWVQAANDEERSRLAIPHDRLALKVRGVFGKEVGDSGLKKGDVIIKFGDRTDHHSEGQFHAELRLNYFRPNAVLPLTVTRGDRKMDITVKFANK